MSSAKPYALVVDDNAIVLMDACDILERAGFDCFDEADGDAAWKILEQHADAIMLLFSDVEMPGSMNGFDLARKVAATYPEIEVVLASGRLSPSDNDLPGRTTFIGKPFSADIVHDHLRTKLSDEKMPPLLKRAG
jgi:CheY-like chemotaxis protein